MVSPWQASACTCGPPKTPLPTKRRRTISVWRRRQRHSCSHAQLPRGAKGEEGSRPTPYKTNRRLYKGQDLTDLDGASGTRPTYTCKASSPPSRKHDLTT